MTLMTAENLALHHRNKLHYKVNKIENSFFNCNSISQYYCILHYIKVTLVSIRDFFQNGSLHTVKLPLTVTSILTVNMFQLIKMLQTTVSDLFKCHVTLFTLWSRASRVSTVPFES